MNFIGRTESDRGNTVESHRGDPVGGEGPFSDGWEVAQNYAAGFHSCPAKRVGFLEQPRGIVLFGFIHQAALARDAVAQDFDGRLDGGPLNRRVHLSKGAFLGFSAGQAPV